MKGETVMKIAVAADGPSVSAHFGHCEGFAVYTVRGQAVEAREFVPNPGHRPGFLPNFLGDLGVDVIIAGGMGGNAVEMFEARGIRVITGASGSAEQAVAGCLAGSLQSAGGACSEHSHADSCGNY